MAAFLKGFVYAGRGILHCLHRERNMRVHFICMIYMYGFLSGGFFEVSRTQLAIIFAANAMVMMGEMINTAVERAVDFTSTERADLAKQAKDTAAGAVLIAAIFAVAIGIVILYQPAAFAALADYFKSHIISLIIFLLSLPVAFIYIFAQRKDN